MSKPETEGKRGVWHALSNEQLREFAKISAEEKLRWLETVRQTLRQLPADRQATIQKFREGKL